MFAGFSFILFIYSLAQAAYNYFFSKKKAKTSANWSCQNKEICRKTYRGQLFTAGVMLIMAIIFQILGH